MNFKRTVSRLTAGLLLVSALVTPAFAATGTVNTEGSSLRLRSEANTSSSVLKTLGHGTQVEVLSDLADGWYQVSYKGTTGYVSGEYLTIGEDIAIQVFQETSDRIRVAVTAPRDLTILRGEVRERTGADRPSTIISTPVSPG